MNISLLRRIQEQIRLEPDQFNMDSWFSIAGSEEGYKYRFADFVDPELNRIPNCGTAACIAGWAVTLSKGVTPRVACELTDEAYNQTGKNYFVEEEACKILDITEEQGDRLFFAGEWPQEFLERMNGAERDPENIDRQEMAQTAIERIDRFIATNGDE